jgi:glycosyltransferase involved in cell wall biosynthesis
VSDAARIELSVLIASHNRRDLLRRCLESLSRQTQDPATFEVIVADDGSSDGTAEMAEAFGAPFRLRVLRLEKGGKSAALNAAIEVAAGSACVFLDDDVVSSPELVAAHLEAHSRPGVLGIGAIDQQPPDADDWYAHAFARAWKEHGEELAGRPARWSDCYGANFSAPRSALREIGGMTVDLDVAEDFDVALRLWDQGCTPVYLPRAHVVHDDQKGCAKMLRDARRQGSVHVELAGRYQRVAGELLDWRSGTSSHELALRRACIVLRVPPRALARLGRLFPGEGRKMIWLHFVRRLAFWRGVRQAAGRAEWARITGDGFVELAPALTPSLTLILGDLMEMPL